MTREDFIKKLNRERYSYTEEGGKIVVTYENNVNLNSLETLPPGVEFKNGRDVWLNSLTSIPPGVMFENEGDVKLESLVGEFTRYFSKWKGNIEGIGSNRLLNKMIELGLFDRR